MTSLQQWLFETRGRLIRHARYFTLQLVERYLTRGLFSQILGRIARLHTRRNCRRSLNMLALTSWGATMKHFAHDFGLRIAAIPELRRTTHHDRVCWPVQRTLTCVHQCVWLR
jgi:hypothetical protein